MALQNIGAGNRDDAFYRYKMPRMITKIEGRGNGIKTNVVNMVDIAKALARPPSYTTKYFGCELGAQSKFDEKSGISLVNGAHETAKLAGLLENFIKKYVQCYGCGNPETEIITTKTQMITLKCAACGFLSDVDMRDKLTAFIIKNPPEPKKGSKDKKAMRRAEKERIKEGEAADEEQKKVRKEAVRKKSAAKEAATGGKGCVKKASVSDEEHSPCGGRGCENGVIGVGGGGGDEEDADDGGVEWQTDASAEAANQRIREQLSSVTAGMVMLSAEDERKPKAEAAERCQKRRGRADDNNNGCCSEMKNIGNEIMEFLKKGCSPSQLKDFMATLSCSGSSSAQEIMNALFFCLFETCDGRLAKEMDRKKRYLGAVVQSEREQALVLHALECFCGKCRPPLCAANEVALALKVMYDEDVVEEELVLEWYRQGSTGPNKDDPIWKGVKPFVDWLQSAESESE